MKMILQHDVHDRKRSINISSCFPGQQIPALTDLPLLTGNDYSCHARPFNEVRITGFTDGFRMFNDVQPSWQQFSGKLPCDHDDEDDDDDDYYYYYYYYYYFY